MKVDRPHPYLVALRAVHSVLAPDMPFPEYRRRVQAYLSTQLGRVVADRYPDEIIEADRASQFPDNSAKYEDVSYRYVNSTTIAAAQRADRPLCLLTWHHGANAHIIYGLVRQFPDIAVFTRRTEQYGGTFTYSTLALGKLMLVKLRAVLNAGRPVLYYVDGVPDGRTIATQMLAYPARICTGPMALFASIPEACLAPVTTWYAKAREVAFEFHPPLEVPPSAADRAHGLIDETLRRLTAGQSRVAPAQVIPRFLPVREWMADRDGAPRG